MKLVGGVCLFSYNCFFTGTANILSSIHGHHMTLTDLGRVGILKLCVVGGCSYGIIRKKIKGPFEIRKTRDGFISLLFTSWGIQTSHFRLC